RLHMQRDLPRERLPELVFGHVEIRLVERERLDFVSHALKDLVDPVGRFLVLREVRVNEDELRTQKESAPRGHRRTHAELPAFIRPARDPPATLRAPADRDGLPPQLRPVALLDGRVEGVHVDVDDLPLQLHGSFYYLTSSLFRGHSGVNVT